MTEKIDYDLVHKDIIENLKNIDTKTELRGFRIESCDKNEIKVTYIGHQVGGSYVHAHEVAPKYVEDIEYYSNRHTIWNGRDRDDRYMFTIYTNNIKDNDKYVPKGEILRVENCSYAFEYKGGHTWALLYIFTRELNRPGNILNKFKIKIKDNILSVDNKDIAYIVKYIPQESYTSISGNVTYGRTVFTAIFDIFIEKHKIEEILCNKYKEIVNHYFKGNGECESVHTTHDFDHGDRIEIRMKNKFKHEIGSHWNVLNETNSEDILKYYDNYISHMRHIVLPSGKDVEILNENELYEKMRNCGTYHRHYNFTLKNAIVMMLKYDNYYDLDEKDIDFLSFKLYRLYPENIVVQSIVL